MHLSSSSLERACRHCPACTLRWTESSPIGNNQRCHLARRHASTATAVTAPARPWHATHVPRPSARALRSFGAAHAEGTMLIGSSTRRAAILGGVRIPFARGYTAYDDADDQELLTASLAALIERYKLRGERLGDVIAGAVTKHPKDYNLTRESVLSSALDPQTPGLDVQRACGTSLEAAILIANKIALGQIEVGIAGGVDTVSDPPMLYPRSFQRILLRSARGRSLMQRLGPWATLRPRVLKPTLPAVVEPQTGLV